MAADLWQRGCEKLAAELPEQQFNTWIRPLPAAGVVCACVSDMGLDPLWARGFALIGRSAGLVAHLLDEKRAPLGQKLWDLVLAQDDSAELAGHDNPIPQRAQALKAGRA